MILNHLWKWSESKVLEMQRTGLKTKVSLKTQKRKEKQVRTRIEGFFWNQELANNDFSLTITGSSNLPKLSTHPTLD
jgi:hypothetical protein